MISENFRKLFGVKGAGAAGLRWIEFNPETGFGILRCNLEAVAQVRTTLAVSTSLNGGKIRLCTVRVSGTLKTLREFLREKARS